MALWRFTTLHNNLKQIFSTSIKSLSQCAGKGKQYKYSSGFWLGCKLLTGQLKIKLFLAVEDRVLGSSRRYHMNVVLRGNAEQQRGHSSLCTQGWSVFSLVLIDVCAGDVSCRGRFQRKFVVCIQMAPWDVHQRYLLWDFSFALNCQTRVQCWWV